MTTLCRPYLIDDEETKTNSINILEYTSELLNIINYI